VSRVPAGRASTGGSGDDRRDVVRDDPDASWERERRGRNLAEDRGNAEAHVDEQGTAGDDVELDDSFHEAAALDEIELFSELLIATSSRSAPLSQRELDSLLGVDD
jgi:hypothetical protein